MATANGIQNSVKQAAHAIGEGDFATAKDNVELAARQAARELEKASNTATKQAKAHPVATAGLLLGTGALVGALLYRVLNPAPTPGQVLLNALKKGGESAGNTLMSGISQARRAMH